MTLKQTSYLLIISLVLSSCAKEDVIVTGKVVNFFDGTTVSGIKLDVSQTNKWGDKNQGIIDQAVSDANGNFILSFPVKGQGKYQYNIFTSNAYEDVGPDTIGVNQRIYGNYYPQGYYQHLVDKNDPNPKITIHVVPLARLKINAKNSFGNPSDDDFMRITLLDSQYQSTVYEVHGLTGPDSYTFTTFPSRGKITAEVYIKKSGHPGSTNRFTFDAVPFRMSELTMQY